LTAVAEAHGHGGHGPPPAHQSSRVPPVLVGIYLFLASEAMLFGSFFAAYFFARVSAGVGEWPPLRPDTEEHFHLPVFLALVNTIILVTSSFTVHWAMQSIKRDNRAGLVAGLGLTFMLGLTFLLIQAREYTRLGFSPRDTGFASTFYGLTGLHGLHVFVGLNLLLYAFIRASRGHYSAHSHFGVEIPGIYWHFVDVMWIVVYTTVYIV
jgi:cytochrome c oxidase subunit 3